MARRILATLALVAALSLALPAGSLEMGVIGPRLARPSAVAVAQPLESGAQAFEAAYVYLARQHLRAVPSRDLLQAGLGGLNTYLRARGLQAVAVVFTGQENPDLAAVRAAVDAAGRRLGSTASARDAAHAAIDGMVRAVGDPYTKLAIPRPGLGPARPAGGYSGVGVVLNLEVFPPVVTQVIEGGPAQRAGLRSGDIVMEIDGRTTVGMPPQEVVARLRGLPGTPVAIRVRRGIIDVAVTIVREVIALVQVAYRRVGTAGYIRLREFDQGAGEEVTVAVAELQRQGARAIILDLRGNPGGFVDEAISVASVFLRSGVVATSVNRAGERTRYPVSPLGFKFAGPTAVLVDRQSASASEMVAGALQDAGHGVIGRRTFGKGSVQVTRRLPGGAVLHFTVAQYITPNGTPVEGRGIHPTVDVETAEGTIGTEEDRVLQAALQWLAARTGHSLRAFLRRAA